MRDGLSRLLVASSVLVVWLALLTSRQTALYPTVAQPAAELVPISVTIGAIVAAAVGPLVASSTSVAVVCMAVLSYGAALVAAQLGAPSRMHQPATWAATTAETSAGQQSWAASSHSSGGPS
jgi:hypothetical protein